MHSGAAVIFLASLSFTIYILFGYPLLLAVLARNEHKIQKRFEPKDVSILLTVYNGEKWIRDKLLSILDLDYPPELKRVTVISDGSTDRTDEIVQGFASQGVELLRVPRGGKAEQTLLQTVNDLPDVQGASTLLAEYYNKTGQMDHAATVFQNLDSKYPKSFAIKLTYARILFEKKEIG